MCRRRAFTLIEFLVVLAIIAILIGLLLPANRKVREAAARVQCANNLKQIGLAAHNYHDSHHYLPPATLPHPDLPPERRLSWMVALLPYVEADNLYSRLKRDRAWDDPQNARLVPTDYKVYRCPSLDTAGRVGLGSYVGIAGVGDDAPTLPSKHRRAGILGHDRFVKLKDVADGTSTTLFATETMRDIGPWVAGDRPTVRGVDPDEAPVEVDAPFGSRHDGQQAWSPARVTAQVLLADGSVRTLGVNCRPDVFAALATIAGGEEVPNDF
jgi:prepilin-type N-terminal cleavage/methylation domain-containing protein